MSAKLSKEEKKQIRVLEKACKVRCRDRQLLKQALIHKSYAYEQKLSVQEHNERLEFLGDAVLELVVSHLLMERYPDASEGQLSKIRAALVNEKTLSQLARKLKLGEQLYLGKGEESTHGREKNSILSNTYEAILGAFYLDRGFKKVSKVIRAHIETLLNQEHDDENGFCDYKTELQEKVQNRYHVIPRYRLIETTGPEHSKTFRIALFVNQEEWGEGEGRSKKEAEQQAAKAALVKLAETVIEK